MNACSYRETGVLPAFTLRCRTGLRRLLDKMVLLNAAAFYFENILSLEKRIQCAVVRISKNRLEFEIRP